MKTSFATLKTRAPAEMAKYVAYFDATHVNGVAARGRCRASAPRYAPHLWNQHDATLEGTAKTNNVSEGWHNRFYMLMRKNHPDLYVFLQQIINKQLKMLLPQKFY